MKLLIACASLLWLLAIGGEGHPVVDTIFALPLGLVQQLQEKNITDPTGCYVQCDDVRNATNDIVTEFNKTEINWLFVGSDFIDLLKTGFCVYEYCQFHDTEDSIKHFMKHPGDLLGRFIWNLNVSIRAFRALLKGIAELDLKLIGMAFGDAIYVLFDGKIL